MYLGVGGDADANEIDQITRQLRTEINELEVESVDLVRDGVLPGGAKSADPVTLGALAMVVLPAVIPKLIELLQSWSMRGENRMIKLKAQSGDRIIEVEYSPTTMSTVELERLLGTVTEALPPVGKNRHA